MKKEDLKLLKNPLKIADIDIRIKHINKGGYATVLAYKDARVDMNRLDEVCGSDWQNQYELIDGQLFCRIGIKIDDQWIWRQDVGAESLKEKTKGRASDAFKRAAFRWGIGRELYDYPAIQVKLNSSEFRIENDKAKATFNLKLKDWIWHSEFKDGKVTRLTAKDERGVLRFDNTSAATTQFSTEEMLPFLNKIDKQNNLTSQWSNVVAAINECKVTSLSQIRKHYNLSKELASELEQLINFQKA